MSGTRLHQQSSAGRETDGGEFSEWAIKPQQATLLEAPALHRAIAQHLAVAEAQEKHSAELLALRKRGRGGLLSHPSIAEAKEPHGLRCECARAPSTCRGCRAGYFCLSCRH